MKSFIFFFFLIHSVRITDFDNYLSFVPKLYVASSCIPKRVFTSIDSEDVAQCFHHPDWARGNSRSKHCMYVWYFFFNFEYTHLAHWVLCGEFCFAWWGKSWKYLNYRSNLNVIFNVAIQLSSERHSRKWSFNRN